MGGGRRSRRRGGRGQQRRQRAEAALSALRPLLEAPWAADHPALPDRAAVQFIAISRRHRKPWPADVRPSLCRGCHTMLRPGVTARVRWRHGLRSTTCLRCGRLQRWRPAPLAHAGDTKAAAAAGSPEEARS